MTEFYKETLTQLSMHIAQKAICQAMAACDGADKTLNLSPNISMKNYVAKALITWKSSGRHNKRSENLRTKQQLDYIIRCYAEGMSHALSQAHDLLKNYAKDNNVSTPSEQLIAWAIDCLVPSLIHVLEVWNAGLKSAVLVAYFSMADHPSLSQYDEERRVWEQDRKELVAQVTSKLGPLAAIISMDRSSYDAKYIVSFESITSMLSSASVQTKGVLALFDNKNTQFLFQDGLVEDMDHASRFGDWYQTFAASLLELKKRGDINFLHFPTHGIPAMEAALKDDDSSKTRDDDDKMVRKEEDTNTNTEEDTFQDAGDDDNMVHKEEDANTEAIVRTSVAKPKSKAKKSRALPKAEYAYGKDVSDPREKSWQEMPLGSKYMKCPHCDHAKFIPTSSPSYSLIKCHPVEGRYPVDMDIDQPMIRGTYQWKSQRKHTKNCTIRKFVKTSDHHTQKHKEEGDLYLEKWYPTILRQKKVKYDQNLAKKNGNYDQGFYRSQQKRNLEAKIYEKVKRDVLAEMGNQR